MAMNNDLGASAMGDDKVFYEPVFVEPTIEEQAREVQSQIEALEEELAELKLQAYGTNTEPCAPPASNTEPSCDYYPGYTPLHIEETNDKRPSPFIEPELAAYPVTLFRCSGCAGIGSKKANEGLRELPNGWSGISVTDGAENIASWATAYYCASCFPIVRLTVEDIIKQAST